MCIYVCRSTSPSLSVNLEYLMNVMKRVIQRILNFSHLISTQLPTFDVTGSPFLESPETFRAT